MNFYCAVTEAVSEAEQKEQAEPPPPGIPNCNARRTSCADDDLNSSSRINYKPSPASWKLLTATDVAAVHYLSHGIAIWLPYCKRRSRPVITVKFTY